MSDRAGNKIVQDMLLAEVSEFLRQIDWPCEAISPKVVRTFYRGQFGVSEVIIHIGEQDICLVIDPVVERAGHVWRGTVINLVKTMAQEIKHIGMGLDDDGDLFVKVHLPIEHLNLEHFHCLLLGMCQVAENIVIPVLQANAFDNLKVA